MEEENFRHAGCKNTDALKFKRYIHGNALIGLNCEDCLSEWLVQRYLPSGNLGEYMLIGSERLCLLSKRNVHKFTFKVQPAVIEIRDLTNLAEYLVPGDHIKYHWIFDFYHHAIVKEVEKDSITLIHWHGEDDCTLLKGAIKAKFRAEVVQEKMPLNKLKEKVDVIFKFDYKGGVVEEDGQILTVARATAWLGEIGYLLLTNNCEHFAVFCKIGNHFSFQQDRLIKRLLSFIGETMKHMGIMVYNDMIGSMIELARSMPVCSPFRCRASGLGLVAAFHGVALLFDVRKLYRQRNAGTVGEEEFVGRFWHNVYNRLDKVFYSGLVPAGCVVILGAILPSCAIATAASISLGVICAGILSIPWGYNGEVPLGGQIVSTLVRKLIKHHDQEVTHIRQLFPGDHIVLYRWFLHPRCHVIVTDIDVSKDILQVIRYTYRKGVVEQKLSFHTPLRRVVHERPFATNEIIQRARENVIQAQAYNIFKFNCKHFAFWCETDTVPSEP